MSERINARLDDELAQKLAHLQARTGKSTTELIRASIESYFERFVGAAGPRVLLDEFVGCASAERDLSETYKTVLEDSVAKKVAGGKPAQSKLRRRGAS